ncbi:serine hydrolase domain-containing protein [Roseixanthobacter glucoisosaccharinicivorans]|uniref:serine hydrolase domain-containing protein n=1 Tax=Roseixanthobacter glucoisosaccharinicivorans TaxID=3119923 RepID=UPI003727678B
MMIPDSDQTAQIHRLFRDRIQDDAPGAVLAVLSGGECVLEHAYGRADLAQNVPLDGASVLRVGSQSKQFAVYLALQLARAGRLSLDDAVGKHVSWVPSAWRHVRLRSLAANTSGIRDLLDLMVLGGVNALGPVSRDLERRVIAMSPGVAAEEGADLLYSNSNFLLLTDAVEAASGAPFEDLLARYVTGPLGMADTRLLWRDDEWTPRLAGHYRRDGAGGFLRAMSLAALGGEGGLVSTRADMVRWQKHLRAGHLSGDPIISQMEPADAVPLASGSPSPYGLGLVRTVHGGVVGIGHGGSVVGARSESVRFPGPDLGVVLIANREDIPVFALVRQVLDILLRRPSAAFLPEEALAPLRAMSGVWREEGGGRVLELAADAAGATLTTSMGPAPLVPAEQGPGEGDWVIPQMALPPLAVLAQAGAALHIARWGRVARFVPARPDAPRADPRGRYRARDVALEAEVTGDAGDLRITLASPYGICRARLLACDGDLFRAVPDAEDLHGRWLASPWNSAWLFSAWVRPGGLVLNSDQSADLVFDRL